MTVATQPTKQEVRHPSKAWRKGLVADAKKAITRDPAYFSDMLEALHRAQTKRGLTVVR